MKRLILIFIFLSSFLFHANVFAQDSLKIDFGVFLDIYYAYDWHNPANHTRQPFLYNHNRHNQLNVNLGMISAKVQRERLKVNLALMAGTYAQDNLSHEQPLLRNIFEASIAYALDHNSKWWIQAGVFPSHLGFESAVSTENLAYTRTLAAENSPYYLSGIKLIHHFSEQWSISLLALNGWQQISRPFNDQNIALGSQLQYQQGNGFTFNWSTYLASKHPVSNTEGRERFFNNIYMIWPVSDVFDIIGGFDIGLQKSDRSDVDWQHWYSPVFIGSYKMNSKLSATFRLEFYDDPHLSEISPPGSASDGFGLISGSVGVNILLLAQLMLRMEYRCFASSDTPYYNYTSNRFTSFNSFFISGLAFILP